MEPGFNSVQLRFTKHGHRERIKHLPQQDTLCETMESPFDKVQYKLPEQTWPGNEF